MPVASFAQKADSAIVAKGKNFPEAMEKDMVANAEIIQKLEAELQRVKTQNDKYYEILLQINGVKREDLIDAPSYEAGKMTFKVRTKPK